MFEEMIDDMINCLNILLEPLQVLSDAIRGSSYMDIRDIADLDKLLIDKDARKRALIAERKKRRRYLDTRRAVQYKYFTTIRFISRRRPYQRSYI